MQENNVFVQRFANSYPISLFPEIISEPGVLSPVLRMPEICSGLFYELWFECLKERFIQQETTLLSKKAIQLNQKTEQLCLSQFNYI